ncbi:NAD-dependent epimerase/dehydratase family protein [Candidatus Pelagibacter sp. HIMB1321]|uniref:NAD-dependent epimerase/dehydratase family protein n=1 Tax=Candidatus Pelagibacter sp. HIMB1321 TaxID=1388755 RepID=UPI000A081B94|nr:NAD-dependent epimerase/dehydratase family protein [Candidatus Pelagibacter sp. HIMB1321]SMF79539.1 UDP-glucose 4-epimerase [Candidatus Pelagibacter sp. HIMB1321]
MKKKKILVTGAAGFIGSKICAKLVENNYSVIGCDDFSSGSKKNITKKTKFIKIDLSKKKRISNLPKKIDYIFHLAGQSSGEKSFDDPLDDLDRNFKTTYNLINYAKKNSIKNFFYASSMSVYGNTTNKAKIKDYCKPLSYYGLHKKLSEDYILKNSNNFNYIIFRMFNVYGPGQDLLNQRQGMVSIYLSNLLKRNKIIVKGSTERFRDFIYIDDVVDIWIEALKNKKMNNKIINLGTGQKTKIMQILQFLRKIHFKKSKVIIKNNTPGDQFGIFADKSIFDLTKKKKFIGIKKGIEKFYYWAKKSS